MKVKNVLAGVAIVLALVVSFVALGASTTSNSTLGAVSGPDISSPYISVNGVRTEYRKAALGQATTTVCVLQAPTSGTSTLVTGTMNFVVSSTTASTVTITKSSVPTAGATVLSTASIGANAQATFSVASSTAGTQVAADRVFSPGQYLVATMSGGTGTFSPSGACQAEFLAVQ